MRKTAPFLSLVTIAFLVAASPVSAQIGSNSQEKVSQLSPAPSQGLSRPQTLQAAPSGAMQNQAQTNPLMTRGVNEIERRLTALTNLLTIVQSSETIASDVKQTITSNIQAEIDRLTQLKTQIEAADQQTARQLLQDSYGSFAVLLPQMRTMLAGESILMLSEKMLDLHERLSMQVTELQSQGVDTTEMDQTLIDIEESITQAQTSATDAIDMVTPLTGDEFPANRTVFQNARTDLRNARLSLVSARDSFKELVAEIKQAQPAMSGSQNETMQMEDTMMQSSNGAQESSMNTLQVETSN